jgi:hypothetical protein
MFVIFLPMTPGPEGDPELQRQRGEIESAFREEWRPPGAESRLS